MTHIDTAKSPYQSMIGRIPMACFVVAIMSASSEAQLSYDFVDFPSGDVLATLELTSLPATHAEVGGLTFTPAGAAKFGYATSYSGSFDTSFGMLSDDGIGGLQGNGDETGHGNVKDSTPPPTQITTEEIIGIHPPIQIILEVDPSNLFLVADDNVNEDAIAMSYLAGDVGVSIRSVGDWRLVPGPSSIGLCLTAILFGVGLGRKSERYTSRRRLQTHDALTNPTSRRTSLFA